MATQQEVTINFHMKFGALIQKADDIVSSAERDFETLKHFGVTQAMITQIGVLKAAFLNHPTDVQLNSIKVGKTQAKDQKANEVKAGIREVTRRAALKFEPGNWVYKYFDHGDLSEMSDSDLCRAGYAIGRTPPEMLAELASHGLTQDLLDRLEQCTIEFDAAIDAKRIAEKVRNKATHDRRVAANALYDGIMVISNAGKAAFIDTDESLYNDYVIYETPTGNKIAKGTGMITGDIIDQDGTPVPEVTVTVKGTTLVAITDINGQYIIEGVPPNTFTVEAFKTGYGRATIDEVVITEGLATELDFELVADNADV